MTLAKVPDLLVKSPASEVKSSPTWWLDRLASSSARALGGSAAVQCKGKNRFSERFRAFPTK